MSKFYTKISAVIFTAVLYLCVNAVFAQTPPSESTAPETPKKKTYTKPKIELPRPRVFNLPKPAVVPTVRVENPCDTPAEKSIAVDSKVVVLLSVAEGKLKINGWERNEVRVFIKNGSQTGFNVLDKNRKSGEPNFIKILGYDPKSNKHTNPDARLSGEEIQIDVPLWATINVESREGEMSIDSVGKVNIKIAGGDIFLNNIKQGVEATTYEGNVLVAKSSGAMSLYSTSGNIVAYDVGYSEFGDVFKAKTINGSITLQQIEHRQLETNTNSGSINFTSDLVKSGQYKFGTQSGSISLNLPQNASCNINAYFGYGVFNSELPLKDVVKKDKSLSGRLGDINDCAITFTSSNGSLRIRKQLKPIVF